jgi:hypothetical protein
MLEMMPRMTGLDTEAAAAVLLTVAWRIAEMNELCPLCLMDCAVEMMDNAEKQGAIQHMADRESVPEGETAH